MIHAKLLSMTVLLTVLIWAAADSLVNESVSIPITLKTVAAAGKGQFLVSPAGDSESFELQISGPRKAIARIQEATPIPIKLKIPELPTGTSPIALKEALREQWHDFPKVAIVSVRPPQLLVAVDRMIAKELTITVQKLTLPYEVKPWIQPATVQLRLRESLVGEIAPAGQLAPLDISAEAEKLLKDQPPGQDARVVVPLDKGPFGPDATLQPDTVEVRATLTALRKTVEIPTVPILIAVSFSNLPKGFRAVPHDGGELVTQTIKVTGPMEEVDRLLRGETRVYGFIHLKDEHLAEIGVFKPFTPEFQLPAGIELAEKQKPIELKVMDTTRTERPIEPVPMPP